MRYFTSDTTLRRGSGILGIEAIGFLRKNYLYVLFFLVLIGAGWPQEAQAAITPRDGMVITIVSNNYYLQTSTSSATTSSNSATNTNNRLWKLELQLGTTYKLESVNYPGNYMTIPSRNGYAPGMNTTGTVFTIDETYNRISDGSYYIYRNSSNAFSRTSTAGNSNLTLTEYTPGTLSLSLGDYVTISNTATVGFLSRNDNTLSVETKSINSIWKVAKKEGYDIIFESVSSPGTYLGMGSSLSLTTNIDNTTAFYGYTLYGTDKYLGLASVTGKTLNLSGATSGRTAVVITDQTTVPQSLTVGSYYTINAGNSYLAYEGNSITTADATSTNTFWKVASGNTTNGYKLESYKYPGTYLYVNGTALSTTNNANTASSFNHISFTGLGGYLCVGNSLNNLRLDLTAATPTMSAAGAICTVTEINTVTNGFENGKIYSFSTTNGGGLNLAINFNNDGIFSPAFANRSIDCLWKAVGNNIDGFTLESMKAPGYFLTVNNNAITVTNTNPGTFLKNNNQLLVGNSITNSFITNEWAVGTSSTIYFNDHTVAMSHKIIHCNGITGRARLSKHGMQSVHTSTQIVYIKPGESKPFVVPTSALNGYFRWYDFDTNQSVKLGYLENTSNLSLNQSGLFMKGLARTSTYTLPSTLPADFKSVQVTCDVSNYKDYSDTDGLTADLQEPTLSFRQIWEVRDAKEMADKLKDATDKNTFLEEVTVVAPTGTNTVRFGPKYAYTNIYTDVVNVRSNYYGYNAQNVVTQVTSAQWKKDGGNIAITPINGQMIQPAAVTAPQTVVYTLTATVGGNTYNIYKATVIYRDKNAIGPISESSTARTGDISLSDVEMAKKYKLLAERTFNYVDGVDWTATSATNGTNLMNYYPKPLSWEESTYGYTYYNSTNDQTIANRGTGDYFTNYGEYVLIRTTSSTVLGNRVNFLQDGITNHYQGGRTDLDKVKNGYFMYIDAADNPGLVANLSVSTDMCSGSSLYFTAYVIDAGNNTNADARPNLNLVLTGKKADGTEDELRVFTTGNIAMSGTNWNKLFHEFTLAEQEGIDYVSYSIKIYNNGTTASGNDFAIDDIRIYVTNPPTEGFQVLSGCSDGNLSTVVLTNDFLKVGAYSFPEGSEHCIYYRWKNENKQALSLNDYIGYNGASTFGKIPLYKTKEEIDAAGEVYIDYPDTEVEGDYWEDGKFNPKAYISDRMAPDWEGAVYLFVETEIKEETVNGIHPKRPILYVIYRSASLVMNQKYYYTLAYSQNDLASDSDCNLSGSLIILPPLYLEVEGGNVDIDKLCEGSTYKINAVANILNEDGDQVSGIVYCDWLEQSGQASQEEINKVNDNIKIFRTEYHEATTLDMDLTGGYTQAVKDYLLGFGEKLQLYQTSISITLGGDGDKSHLPEYYVIFPITQSIKPKTTDDGEPNLDSFCDQPLAVVFRGVPLLNLGMGYVTLPKAIENEICVARVMESEANGTFDVPVRNVTGNISGIEDQKFTLYHSTDPGYMPNDSIFEYTCGILDENKEEKSGVNLKDGDYLRMTKNTNTSNFDLKEGYEYWFVGTLEEQVGAETPASDCVVKSTLFNVKVVQGIALWEPAGTNSAWNNDANWKVVELNANGTIAVDGGVVRKRPGYVPREGTSIILPSAAENGSKKWPVLPTVLDNEHETEAGAQAYITYDLFYKKWNCDNIYFKAGSKLANQAYLNYNKAWVDMEVKTKQYQLLSAPLQGVYSGDMYMPEVNPETTVFEALAPVHIRSNTVHYPIWASVFNQSAYYVYTNVDPYMEVKYSEWSAPTNYLGHKYDPGTGFALWPENIYDRNSPFVIRLPKLATRYDYYDTAGNVVPGKYEVIPRLSNDGNYKLAFTPNEIKPEGKMTVTLTNWEEGNTFLVGNPLMTDLDMNLFFTENTHLQKVFWVYNPDSEGNNICVPVTEGNNFLVENNVTNGSFFVSPMQSFFVKLNDTAGGIAASEKTLQVVFTPAMSAGYITPTANNDPQPSPAYLRSSYAAASDYYRSGKASLMIETEREGYKSRALLVMQKGASMDYSENEDAELLMLDRGMTPFAIFTVADKKALSIQVIPESEKLKIPLGLHALDSKSVYTKWKFTGVDNFPLSLYLYDAVTKRSEKIEAGKEYMLETSASTNGRYYITDGNTDYTNIPAQVAGEKVRLVNHSHLKATVYAPTEIESIRVSDLLGKRIVETRNLNALSQEITFPTQGVYIVSVETKYGISGTKIIIK